MTDTAVLAAPADSAPSRIAAPGLTKQRVILALPLLLFCGLALHLIATTPFPAPDELEHVSYAAYLREHHRLLPEFAKHRTLRRDDLSRWDDRPNYIGHPSPYYVFIAPFLDRSLPPTAGVLGPRLASFALFLIGLIVALRAGVRSFGPDPAALALFSAGLVACPELLSIARQVTNDSLAMLGGALAFWGACAVGRHRWGWPAGALGLALALWAKPNAGLEVALFLAVFAALQRPVSRRAITLLAAGGAVGALPYAGMLLDYGAVVPVSAETIWNVRHMDGIAGYLPVFFLNIGRTWGFMRTGAWPMPQGTDALTALAFWAMVGCIAYAAWSRLRAPGGTVAMAGVVAFALVLPVHLWFAAANLGYSLPAASFRYYLPLWPALIYGLAFALQGARSRSRVQVAAIALAAFASGWVPDAP